MVTDIRLKWDGGSVALIVPETAEGQAWIDEHVDVPEWAWVGDAVACELRYVDEVLYGAESYGLVVDGVVEV